MTWTWQFEKADGARGPPPRPGEGELGQSGRRGELARRELAQPAGSGVDQVSLVEDGRREYGPMGLHPGEY